jgi:hypothetical protein
MNDNRPHFFLNLERDQREKFTSVKSKTVEI